VQYTGVAKTASFETSQWLASLRSQVDMNAPLKWLSDRLLEAGRRHIRVSDEHTFSVAGCEGERPFVIVVSNFQSFDANRLSLIPASRRKWEATARVGRHGAFATGSAEHVNSDELDALPKFARTHPTIAVHRKLAELNRTAARRAGANGPISESCFTGQMSLDGSGGLITWEFPRLCRGGSRSLTYTAVVFRETCDGLRHDVMRGGNKANSKQLRSRMQQGKHKQMGLFLITSVGHLGEVPMSSWRLLGVSVIGIGEVSLASPSRFERLTH
jgi:hypothetical protein